MPKTPSYETPPSAPRDSAPHGDPPPSAPYGPPPIDPVAARTAFAHATLEELTQLGMRLVRRVVADDEAARAATPGTDAPTPEADIAYERLARAIRRNLALARALDAPAKPLAARDIAPRATARARILRDVENVIDSSTEGEQAERLNEELRDRLESAELEAEIGIRPVADIVVDICRDLGLGRYQPFANEPSAQWKRRTPADVANLHARAAAPPGQAPPYHPTPVRPPPTPSPRPGDDLDDLTLALTLLHPTRFRGKTN